MMAVGIMLSVILITCPDYISWALTSIVCTMVGEPSAGHIYVYFVCQLALIRERRHPWWIIRRLWCVFCMGPRVILHTLLLVTQDLVIMQ